MCRGFKGVSFVPHNQGEGISGHSLRAQAHVPAQSHLARAKNARPLEATGNHSARTQYSNIQKPLADTITHAQSAYALLPIESPTAEPATAKNSSDRKFEETNMQLRSPESTLSHMQPRTKLLSDASGGHGEAPPNISPKEISRMEMSRLSDEGQQDFLPLFTLSIQRQRIQEMQERNLEESRVSLKEIITKQEVSA